MAKTKIEKLTLAVGEVLKELRIKKGFSSYENFALEYNLDRKQYWRMETGSNLTISSLHKILEIHNLNASDFFKAVEKKL